MPSRRVPLIRILIAGAVVVGWHDAWSDEAFFESRIRPLLVDHCYECHSVESGESAGGLRLDTAAGVRRGGVGGPAIDADRPADSLILEVVRYDGDIQMPPEGRLSDSQIDDLQRWITEGAFDPRTGGDDITETAPPSGGNHWAFAPIERTPTTGSAGPAGDAIDRLSTAVAAAVGVTPAAAVDDRTWLIRASVTLRGTRPTFEETRRFVNDADDPMRKTRWVDRWLASPDFAERFARHWMDVARYADTVGYALAKQPRELVGAWRYRDWLIDAFAADLPYDAMIRHQLAADRTGPDEHADAMGFLTVGRRFLNPLDTIDDRIDVITRGLLGMTVACARCHDHKFDPIPTTDYYALFGVMQSSDVSEDDARPLMMVDNEHVGDRPVLVRGQPGRPGPVAKRQFLTALRRDDEPAFTDGSGRGQLADRIVAADNPLTARVMVNRVWTHLIGRPLVDTPSDFGVRTPPPVVPEILEELADDFRRDWSVKRLVRRIVLSDSFARSATADDGTLAADPDNRALARGTRRRMDFETLRDSMLASAGELDRRVGGESVSIDDRDNRRRTVYSRIDRQDLPPLFRTFDYPDPNTHAERRFETMVPQQALFLMNDPDVAATASRAAERMRHRYGDDVDVLAKAAFRRVLGREATSDEVGRVTDYLSRPMTTGGRTTDPRLAWRHGLLDVREESEAVRIDGFRELSTYKDHRYQFADRFPADPPVGHARAGRGDAHSAHDPSIGVTRRFIVPGGGQIQIVPGGGKTQIVPGGGQREIVTNGGRLEVVGTMRHHASEGDGVRLRVVVTSGDGSGQRVIGDVRCHAGETLIEASGGEVSPGDVVDLVATNNGTPGYDHFELRCKLQIRSSDGVTFSTDTFDHFTPPAPPPVAADPLATLVQTLWAGNEFLFID